ncbi:hypothetical protein AB0J21_07015 [Streptomyces sp. NPDC049954]|uniref:hypothetical protein n=1 Tax=Streptomyces sp. NPDC049954 TaxID=3155779 RepID=UPI00341AF9F7
MAALRAMDRPSEYQQKAGKLMKKALGWLAVVVIFSLPLSGTAHAESALPAKPKAWHATASCEVEEIGKKDHGKRHVKKSATGRSAGEAKKAAQRKAQDEVSRRYGKGFRLHHCTFRTVRK